MGSGLPCGAARIDGGLAPRDPHTLAVRWAGYSNFELAYGGKIVLLDAYFDRGSNYSRSLKARDGTRADVILIGPRAFRPHVGRRVGEHPHRRHHRRPRSPPTSWPPKDVPAARFAPPRDVAASLIKFDGFSVEPILARHGQPDPQVTTVMEGALSHSAPEPGAAEEAEERAIRARGVSDPRVIARGTVAYLITLDRVSASCIAIRRAVSRSGKP